MRAGEGFLSQNSKRLHFGFGPDERISGVKVTWPDGQEEQFDTVELGGHYHLVQGSGKAVAIGPRNGQLKIPRPKYQIFSCSRIKKG